MVTLFAGLELARNELLLFAGIGLLLGGLDDLFIDLLYVCRRVWRDLTVYRRFPRMSAADLPPPGRAGPIAIFIPAWDEADVIGPMLRRCLRLWAGEDMQIFVGVYPNDRATAHVVADAVDAADHARVSIVVNPAPGPTTKADCLNRLWLALEAWESAQGRRAHAVVLHDAEDVVHADALRLIGMLCERFALVQLPVLPLVASGSRWVSGHYLDEFAEAHGKSLLVREALGAAMPSAGVGCGFSREAIGRMAQARGGAPFDPQSLTEDYELGLRIGELGGRGILVRMRDTQGGLIATREYFPDTLSAAVRQKARWMVGIALSGWDRIGWSGHLRERWMRLRDRGAALAALVLAAAYLGLALTALLVLLQAASGIALEPLPPALAWLVGVNFALLVWRLAVRMLFVWEAYGPLEGLLSIPRTIVGNIIAMMAARRAVAVYVRHLRGRPLRWDKTAHRFPAESAARPQ